MADALVSSRLTKHTSSERPRRVFALDGALGVFEHLSVFQLHFRVLRLCVIALSNGYVVACAFSTWFFLFCQHFAAKGSGKLSRKIKIKKTF